MLKNAGGAQDLKTSTDVTFEAELRRLREDNEALRFSSLTYAGIADRLAQRVRDLEQSLSERVTETR